ncbi:MAG: hypothetical protein RI897_365 [Verrucomicrobiota bacterium]|jgi:hypothetical protein
MKDYLTFSLDTRPLRAATVLRCCLFAGMLTLGGHAWAADSGAEAGAGQEESGGDEAAASAKPFQFDIPKSVFITDENPDVRDPFFPASRRRWGLANTGPVQAVVPEEQLVARHVVLRGITGFEGSKVALINGKTFVEGDEAPVKLPDDLGQLKLKVLKVYENSVEFIVVGKTNVYRKQLE